MKSRALIICACVAVCGLSVAGVVRQGRQLDALRVEGARLQQELQGLQDEQPVRAITSAAAKTVTSSPSPELLRLRNQVSQLARRERELAGVTAENARLQTRIASARTNATIALPAGYIRAATARNLGYASPEASLETLLWAIRNRDFTNVLASFSPRLALDLQKEVEREQMTVDKFFERADALPGFNVLERGAVSNDIVELKLEISPASSGVGEPMRFRLFNGEWKVDSK
jgi:hypothetical protein